MKTKKLSLKRLAQAGIAAGAISYSGLVMAADTIKVGVLHSLWWWTPPPTGRYSRRKPAS